MDKFLYGCIYLSAAIAVSVLLMIICYVTVRGIGSVSLEFLTTVTSAALPEILSIRCISS